ncbi:MAG: hypothetical protein HQL72_09710 [Magnetococcales bacterium]|nr:hypothetical protein [Magnetococcales bacterium]
MGGWGCPHERNGCCVKVANLPCDPGMKGCVLSSRFTFSKPEKNRPKRDEQGRRIEPEKRGGSD